MEFNSLVFIFLFLPITLLVQYMLKAENRNFHLMISSLIFYVWGGGYQSLFIILCSIAINYFSGLIIDYFDRANQNVYKKICFIFCICCNLLLLFYYKYFDFSIQTLNTLFHTNYPMKNILLPIGISFFTFQGMSYTIDLYRKNVPVQKSLSSMTLYIALFPQLIAGPIVRYIDIYKQMNNRRVVFDDVSVGIKRFIIGLSKKVLLANSLGQVADKIFDLGIGQISFKMSWLAIICYSFQIYFDFSGYSDMAIGLGRLLGFRFNENFNYPYISKTITEFWRRWHISLSSWFRDYVYIPLGGNRKGKTRTYINLLIIFIITGFWHGANWTFVVWGLYHGFFLALEKLIHVREVKSKVTGLIRFFLSMLIICIGWVFFRSENLQFALDYLKTMFRITTPSNVGYSVKFFMDVKLMMVLIASTIASTPIIRHIKSKIKNPFFIVQILGNASLIFLFFLCIVYIFSSTYEPFIYFRF